MPGPLCNLRVSALARWCLVSGPSLLLLLMDGQCMVSGSERGAWSREEAAAILDCIASLEWTGVGCDNGPDIQLYAQIVPLVLRCGGEQ